MPGPVITNPQAAKAAAAAKAREQAAKASQEAANAKALGSGSASASAALTKFIPASECKERARLIFDDSGSMSPQIQNAKEGTTEYLRNCPPNSIAVAIHFLCTKPVRAEEEESGYYGTGKYALTHSDAKKLATLNSNLIEVADTLKRIELRLGGTPLFTTMMEAIAMEPYATRYVAFSDGSPTDQIIPRKHSGENEYEEGAWNAREDTLSFYKRNADVVIAKLKERGSPMDTVFFGYASHEIEIAFMKYLAEQSGGYFLHFDPAKVNFRTAFKYLAPVNRLMLASESVRKEIESGKRS